jgi:hypothetical protein
VGFVPAGFDHSLTVSGYDCLQGLHDKYGAFNSTVFTLVAGYYDVSCGMWVGLEPKFVFAQADSLG